MKWPKAVARWTSRLFQYRARMPRAPPTISFPDSRAPAQRFQQAPRGRIGEKRRSSDRRVFFLFSLTQGAAQGAALPASANASPDARPRQGRLPTRLSHTQAYQTVPYYASTSRGCCLRQQPLQRLFIRILAIGSKGCWVVSSHLITLFTQFYSRRGTTQQPNNL